MDTYKVTKPLSFVAFIKNGDKIVQTFFGFNPQKSAAAVCKELNLAYATGELASEEAVYYPTAHAPILGWIPTPFTVVQGVITFQSVDIPIVKPKVNASIPDYTFQTLLNEAYAAGVFFDFTNRILARVAKWQTQRT